MLIDTAGDVAHDARRRRGAFDLSELGVEPSTREAARDMETVLANVRPGAVATPVRGCAIGESPVRLEEGQAAKLEPGCLDDVERSPAPDPTSTLYRCLGDYAQWLMEFPR